MDRGISFTKELIKQASDELNIPEREVEEAYYQMVNYILYSLKNKPINTISIPEIGTLYLRRHFVESEIKEIRKKNQTNRIKIKLQMKENQLNKIDNTIEEFKKTGTRIPSILTSIKGAMKKSFWKNNEEFSWEEVENKQNN